MNTFLKELRALLPKNPLRYLLREILFYFAFGLIGMLIYFILAHFGFA